ncbi:hypothetical protein [Ramlibacter sp. PS4R-6]|uniref:hypothetical protein n=1 Tax=Ramlibacter sp. PS4R-6 TaxID=3133438 RepID=UPI0030965825
MTQAHQRLVVELPVVPVAPVAPVAPEFGLFDGVVDGAVDGVVDDVLELVLGVVVDSVALPLVVPVAPIDDVDEPGVVLPVVVSVVVLLVLVLGVVLPEPVVVVAGVVLLEDVAPVPLVPVVDDVSALRWQALSERAAAMASATAVYWVFIRTPCSVCLESGKGSRDCPGVTLGRVGAAFVGSGSKRV